MIIAFEDRKLREICEDQDVAINEYGPAIAETLMKRLADLVSLRSPAEIPVGNPTELLEFPIPHFGVDLAEHRRLIFCANHTSNHHMKDGKINWTKVTRIKIVKIERSHE